MPQFVGGKYQLIAQLGGGGMADVFLAKLSGKSEFAKLSVVKKLKSTEDDDPEITAMFADEARLTSRLNHPSIVQTFEVGEDESGPFLVMEYIEGQPLGRIRSRAARRGKTLSRAMALKIMRETVGALAYAHELADHDGKLLKVVHRDVSPENIMVTYAGLTKLVDFGVAKTAASMSKTRAGVLKGKVAYMAPEQARSDENIDERVDIFAVGLILWELLTAKRLWEGLSEAKVFERLLDKEPLPRAKEVVPEIPDELDEICAKAIAKDKEDRYATAHELLDALERAIAKLDLRASDREIGQFVSGLFEAEREKVKALVTSAMAKKEEETPSSPKTLEDSDPLMWRADTTGDHSIPKLPTESSKSSGTKEDSKSSTSTAVFETKHAEAQFRTRPAKPLLIGVGAVAALALAVLAGKNLGGAPPPPPVEEPLPVVATETPPPRPIATEPVDTSITIEVTVRPQNARIFVDGARVAGNPYKMKTSRGSAAHEVRAEAEGYETRTIAVTFDRDRAIDLILNRQAWGVPAPAPAPAPTTAPPPAPKPPAPAPAAPAPAPAPAPTGISEIDPSKPKPGQQDKLDTDVFKR
ncbi:MAG: serine/threonine protein kinase [Labilithrix sp.]|nr:serine/threonine protein kinase [Labilithrix sp.]MCW5810381.1 serine/threonine protein kinase [Labilithrix sp.]